MTTCTFPACPAPVTTANRTGQPTCETHRPVVVAVWAADRHDRTEAEQ